jgi:superfamily II DNA/RNA helicase
LVITATSFANFNLQPATLGLESAAKFAALRTLLDRRGDGPTLVFGRTKHGVKKLARQFGELGYPVAALQGNLSQNALERVMADFRSGKVRYYWRPTLRHVVSMWKVSSR